METDLENHEQKLLGGAVAGNSEDLGELLEQFTPLLRGKLKPRIPVRLRSEVEIEDVLQVTYFEAFLHIQELESREISGFVSWLWRIAESNLKDALKYIDRAKRLPPSKRIEATDDEYGAGLIDAFRLASTTPSRLAAKNEALEFLQSHMKRLPEDYRQVLHLYELEQKPAAQVAKIMSRSVGAMYMIRARALDHLRDILGSESRFFSK